MEELGRLDALAEQLSQSYPGATLEDIDLDALEAQLGEQARVDARALAELERELRAPGAASSGCPTARCGCPRRRCGGWGSPRCATSSTSSSSRRGERETRRSGAAGEPTGATRPWAFGDTEAWNVPRTLINAALRRAAGDPRRLDVTDVEIVETEQRTPRRRGAVRRHLVVDGAGRALGADEAHGARAAPADLHPVPRRRPEADHVRPARPGRRAGRADRPGGRVGAGHEPAPRADARRAALCSGTRTPSRSCSSSPTASRPRTSSPTATPSSTTRRTPQTLARDGGARWTGSTGLRRVVHVLPARRRPAAGAVHRPVAPTLRGPGRGADAGRARAPRWWRTTCGPAGRLGSAATCRRPP